MAKKQKDRSQTGSSVFRHGRRTRTSTKQLEGVGSSSPVRTDEESFAFSYLLGVDILLQGHSCGPGVVGSFRRLLYNVLKESDLLGFIEACSAIREDLVTSGRWNSEFSKTPLRWVRGLMTVVEHAIPVSLIVHPSAVFDAVATFLGWLKRLPVCIREHQVGVQEYLLNDRRLCSVQFEQNLYVSDLAEIWSSWFESFELREPFLPRHGSGSTADAGKVRSRKWASLKADVVAHVCFHYPNLDKILDLPRGPLQRTSKVVFVPKQAGKDRTICMEPATLQYLQQGVARQLIEFTHRANHPMSLLVDLFSQERNRVLCSQAEMRGLATIDLSDASDSVSWRLIGHLCKGLPLWRYLYGSRSTSTIIDGQEYHFDKYAPMGSALCFPIECMVFASVVELAYRLHYDKASRGYLSGCSVYGDDIICPSEIYYLVVDILQSLGFKINTKKSYSSGSYFESCGVEYLHGVRINTVRHPRRHLLTRGMASPDDVAMVSDLANDLRSHGYFHARRNLLKSFEDVMVRVGRHVVPFMDLMDFSPSGCIPMGDPYCHRSWNKSFQRSGRWVWSCEASAERSRYDFLEWKSNVPRSPAPHGIDLRVDPKWSRKAVLYLARNHHWDLLREGDIEVVGPRRAGRLRYNLRKRFRGL